MDKGKGKRKSPPPSSVSATSLTKTAAASLNAPKSAFASSKTKNVAASLNAPKCDTKNVVASDSESGKKKHVTSSGLVKASTGSAGCKNKAVVASLGATGSAGGKKKAISSKHLVISATENGKDKEANSDEDPPEEIFQKRPFKKYKGESKGQRQNFAKNPYQCPDLNNTYEWTGKDRKNYTKWLGFESESGQRALTRDEQAYLHTYGVNNPTGQKTNYTYRH